MLCNYSLYPNYLGWFRVVVRVRRWRLPPIIKGLLLLECRACLGIKGHHRCRCRYGCRCVVRVHCKPSRVLEVAPSWPRHEEAILLTPMLTRDGVKEGNPICRVSVFHGWVVQEPALRHTIIHTPSDAPFV